MQTKGKLQEWKGRAKGRWARMRHNDRQAMEAEKDRLVGAAKFQVGRTQRVLEKELDRLRDS